MVTGAETRITPPAYTVRASGRKRGQYPCGALDAKGASCRVWPMWISEVGPADHYQISLAVAHQAIGQGWRLDTPGRSNGNARLMAYAFGDWCKECRCPGSVSVRDVEARAKVD